MDVKSSARAKHASSQRGRARHSNRKQQPQLQQQKQAAIELQQPLEKKDLQLPSNWSRYDEEEEEDKEQKEDGNFDVPPVKSKGANYKDLLAEKSMLQGPDLASGRKALMVTRGLDLWSRFTDMDNLWSKHEVSGEEDNFFILDLDVLNKELAKLDIAERLLLDAEYAFLGEGERSERAHKIPEADTVDEDKTNLTLPSSTSLIKFPASVSVQDIKVLDRRVPTVNEEPGGGGYSDSRLLEKSGATAKLTGDYADSFLNKESEIPDANQKSPLFLNKESEIPDDNQKSYSVSKERLAPLGESTSLFDAKSAEAELDALLDMLDNKTAGQAPNLMPIESRGLARGLPVSDVACSDANPDAEAPNDSPFQMIGSTNSAIKVNSVPFKVPDVYTRENVPNCDEDFDEWLDSL